MRTPQNQNGGAGPAGYLSKQPTTVAFAMVVLAALLILALLRHLFGSIRVEAGTR